MTPLGQPVPRPFLKWAGGKSRLAGELAARLPVRFEGYIEPFAGSAALFFWLVRDGRVRRAVLADLNAELVDAYSAVRDHSAAVIALLECYPYDRDFYYTLRARDPWGMTPAERAARLIYLNKTGYNGLYRVNSKGQFNVPFGRHATPSYCDPHNLRAVARALRDVELVCAPFVAVMERAGAGDMVYVDPPYVPLSPTADFTAYHAGGFSMADQERLRDACLDVARRGGFVMISNSDTPGVRALYGRAPFGISEVMASRAINSKGGRRGKITELVITSYPMSEGGEK